jgi:hypothetical protein
MLSVKLAKANNKRPDSPTRLQLVRVASYRQIIVCDWLILACSGSSENRLSSMQGEPFGLGNLRSIR